jgi:hypothetical protein
VLSTGCQWKALPKDLPPKSTAHHYFTLWDWDGTLEQIHHALYVAAREQAGREASPTAAIIDGQSGKAAQKGALRLIGRALMWARRLRAVISVRLVYLAQGGPHAAAEASRMIAEKFDAFADTQAALINALAGGEGLPIAVQGCCASVRRRVRGNSYRFLSAARSFEGRIPEANR